MNLDKRDLFLIAGHGDPAHNLRDLTQGRINALWSGVFLLAVHEHGHYFNWDQIDRWAVIENINRLSERSHQRAGLPESVRNYLRGSGRWQAADGGGWYELLLGSCLRWQGLAEEEKRAWKKAAEVLQISYEDLARAVENEKAARGEWVEIGEVQGYPLYFNKVRERFRAGCTEAAVGEVFDADLSDDDVQALHLAVEKAGYYLRCAGIQPDCGTTRRCEGCPARGQWVIHTQIKEIKE